MDKSSLEKYVSYENIDGQNDYVKAGAYFKMDPGYVNLLEQKIAATRGEMGTMEARERPPRTFIHVIQHIFTCTSFKEDITKVAPRARCIRQIKSATQTLTMLRLRVAQLEKESAGNRKSKGYGATDLSTLCTVYLSFPSNRPAARSKIQSLQEDGE